MGSCGSAGGYASASALNSHVNSATFTALVSKSDKLSLDRCIVRWTIPALVLPCYNDKVSCCDEVKDWNNKLNI